MRQNLWLECLLLDRPLPDAYPIAPGLGSRSDDPMNRAFYQVDGCPVVEGDPWRHVPLQEEVMIGWPPFSLAVIVWAAAPLQESETFQDGEPVGVRVSNALLKPANRPRANPRQDGPPFPGFP
jgi:hypothetical protein